jgi:hypothetical protein
VTTGRVEWFLAKQAKVLAPQAKQTRTFLNMLFAYALRHDAIARNPVEGTSQLRRTKATPQAQTIDRITAIPKPLPRGEALTATGLSWGRTKSRGVLRHWTAGARRTSVGVTRGDLPVAPPDGSCLNRRAE